MTTHYKRSFKAQGRNASLCVHNVGLQKCVPNYRWGPGVRDHFLIHHVVSGCGTYTVENRTFAVSAGETFLAYPNTRITYCADACEPWEYLWVGFSGNDARLLLAQTDFSPEQPVLRIGEGDRLKRLLLHIYASRGNRPSETAGMTGNLYLFLAYLMAQAQTPRDDDPTATLARRAAAFMSENYAHGITVEDVSRFVGASRSWLYRSFEKLFSVSPSRYLTELRLERAALLLRTTSMPIAEVSWSVGYEDPEYFARVYRQRYNTSPRRSRGFTSGL